MDSEVALYFRNEFRKARAVALEDAEGYQQILFALERFGAYEKGRCEGDKDKMARLLADHIHPGREGDADKKAKGLDAYKECVTALVKKHHPLEKRRQNRTKRIRLYRDSHTAFGRLYEMVMHGRNDALHQGAFARILTLHLVEIALVLEDTLMALMDFEIRNYMIRNPVCASGWQPVSFVRQMMLEHSFTYIPVYMEDEGEGKWYVISDYDIAMYLRSATNSDRRGELLSEPIVKVIESDKTREEACTICPDKKVKDVLDDLEKGVGRPILVARPDNRKELLGIATAHDLM